MPFRTGSRVVHLHNVKGVSSGCRKAEPDMCLPFPCRMPWHRLIPAASLAASRIRLRPIRPAGCPTDNNSPVSRFRNCLPPEDRRCVRTPSPTEKKDCFRQKPHTSTRFPESPYEEERRSLREHFPRTCLPPQVQEKASDTIMLHV